MNIVRFTSALCACVSGCFALQADDHKPEEALSYFKQQQSQSSEVMETVSYLSDVYGPRLTGTPKYLEMAKWVEKRLKSWGVDNVKLEKIGGNHRGWEVTDFSASMASPIYMNLNAAPICCSNSTNGSVEGVPVVVDFYDLDALKALSGKLNGKILLFPEILEGGNERTGRWSDEQLHVAANRLDPDTEDGLDGPSSPVTFADEYRMRQQEGGNRGHALAKFLIQEGVAGLMMSSSKYYGILNSHLDLDMVALRDADAPKPVPFIVLAKEQHGRMLRLLEKGVEPVVKFDLKTTYYENPDYYVNVIAEIEGSDPELKNEIVFIGAHLDSVELGTGASDNGAGSAVAMEILRMFSEGGLKPRRTIRVGLWGAEEQGLVGSLAYVQQNIGDILTDQFGEERDKVVAYFNHDNNGHDIRGIFLLGREEIRPHFEEFMKPFKDWNAETVTIENACCTDIVVFDAAGIPSFEWIQDPENYFTHQLHTSLDVPELLDADVVKRNAVIIANFVYRTAMLEQRISPKIISSEK